MSGSKSICPSATSFVQELLKVSKTKEGIFFQEPVAGVPMPSDQLWTWIENHFDDWVLEGYDNGNQMSFWTPESKHYQPHHPDPGKEWKKWVDDFNQVSEALEVPVRARIELVEDWRVSAVVEISEVWEGQTFFRLTSLK